MVTCIYKRRNIYLRFIPFCIFLFVFTFFRGVAQLTPVGQTYKKGYDTLWLSTPGLVSKNGNEEPCFVLIGSPTAVAIISKKASSSLPTTITGSVTYDYLYRSLIDTPVYTKDFQQHTLSANIRILYKGLYPVTLRFQVRKSNQPLFRDFTDINLRFNPYDFRQVLENRVRQLLANRPAPPDLQRLQQLAGQIRSERDRLNSYVNSPETIQRIVEARERDALKRQSPPNYKPLLSDTTGLESKGNSFVKAYQDSIDHLASSKSDGVSFIKKYQDSLDRLTVLRQRLTAVDDSLLQAKKMLANSRQNINTISGNLNRNKLEEVIRNYHLSEDSLPSGYKKLLAIRQFSAGKSMINYSELSAKNINITGVNVEYNPSWYAAAAIGFTDWQFRDFRTVQSRLPKQYLALGRFGWGNRDKTSIIFTYFTGRRNLLSQYNTGNAGLSSFAISGMSIEGIYHLDPNQQLAVEIAKSSYPKYLGMDPITGKPFESNWIGANDRQNEAYSVSYSGNFMKSGTGLQASYKRIGQYFQSYAFYNTPGQQDAWNIQLDQKVQKWMTLRAGLQKNQYSYPMLAGGLKNDIVFKTLQVTLHYKRWPVIMAGYYPSAQVTLVNNYIPVENRFYTLNISANHGYTALHTYMNSTLVYTRFYNQSTDTGFIYYNSRNISLTQMAWIGKWSLQGSYTGIWQYLGRLNVLEASTSYKLSDAFGLSGGIKYNSLLDVKDVIGYSGGMTLIVNRLGSLQALFDKSYWPGQQHNLLPNTNGRITFIKTF